MKQVKDKFLTYSIIIPVSNRPEGLQTTLRGVFATRQPENTVRNEVVVVNDGSWPDVSKVIATHPQSEKITEVTLPEQSGPATARNRGVEKSTGDWLVFFDDGMEIPDDWLEKAMDYTADYDYLAFDYKLKPRKGEGAVEKLFRLSNFRFESLLKEKDFGGTGGLMVRRYIFDKVGGFNEKALIYMDDWTFGKEVKKCGGIQAFVSEMRIIHKAKTLPQMIKEKERKISHNLKFKEKGTEKYWIKKGNNKRCKALLKVVFLSNHPLQKESKLSKLTFLYAYFCFHCLMLFLKIKVRLRNSHV